MKAFSLLPSHQHSDRVHLEDVGLRPSGGWTLSRVGVDCRAGSVLLPVAQATADPSAPSPGGVSVPHLVLYRRGLSTQSRGLTWGCGCWGPMPVGPSGLR